MRKLAEITFNEKNRGNAIYYSDEKQDRSVRKKRKNAKLRWE